MRAEVQPLEGVPLYDPPIAEAVLGVVAALLHDQIMSQLTVARMADRDFKPEIGHPGDTVHHSAWNGELVPIVLHQWPEAKFSIPDIERALRYPQVLNTYLRPIGIALAEHLDSIACAAVRGVPCRCFFEQDHHRETVNFRRAVIATRNHPSPLRGTGYIDCKVDRDGIGIRVVMGYEPTELSQVFWAQILAGAGVTA